MERSPIEHAALLSAQRARAIELRLRAAMEAGRQPTAAMLADALHEAASACLLIVQASELIAAEADAARAREARAMELNRRLETLLAVPAALLRVGRELLRMMRLAIVVFGRAVAKK